MHFYIMRRAVWALCGLSRGDGSGPDVLPKVRFSCPKVGYSRQPTVKVLVNLAVVYYICNKRDRIK